MIETLNIGATPNEEDCAQVGSADYKERARTECRAYMEQIRKHYPEPENGCLAVKRFPHDFGTYYEVVAYYDPEDSTASRWAFDIEGDDLGVLATWDEEFKPTMEEKKMMYRFILLKDAEEIMGTDVDEPKPQIDAEFWDRFMQGDCEMRFVKSYEE